MMKSFLAALVLLVCAVHSVAAALLVPVNNAVAARNLDYQIREPQPGISDGEAHVGDIHERQELGLIFAGLDIVQFIFSVTFDIKSVIDAISGDKEKRSQWTQSLIQGMWAKDPSHNYVVCHTEHTVNFNGTKGVDWDQTHQEFHNTYFGTEGYEIYGFGSGTFTLIGDGGYLNWCWEGIEVSESPDGRVVVFAAPT